MNFPDMPGRSLSPHSGKADSHPRKIRVAWICSPFSFQGGGTWMHLSSWARCLDRQIFEPALFLGLVKDEDAELIVEHFRKLEETPVHIIPGMYPAKSMPFRGIANLERALKEFQPDILHSVFVHADFAASFLKRRLGNPALISSWETRTIAFDSHPLVRAAYKLLYFLPRARIDGYIAISNDSAVQTIREFRIPRRKVHIIPNGIDIGRYPFRPVEDGVPGKPVIGMISRLGTEKRIDIFVRAVPLVLKEFPGARFVIAGTGPELERLKDLARQLGIADCVQFPGWSDKPEQLLQTFDLFVLTSKSEGLGLVLLEAMASGVPCISTKCGGPEDFLIQDETGSLLPDPTPTSLAMEILTLLRDPDQRKHLAVGARQLVEKRYTQSGELEALHSLYRKTLSLRDFCKWKE